MRSSAADITVLLTRWRDGDHGVEAELLESVYPTLHRIARRHLGRAGGGVTLQATELVSEAYCELARQQDNDWRNRAHFFAIASHVIRRLLVDHFRRQRAEKRGGGVVLVSLQSLPQSAEPAQPEAVLDWLQLDTALSDLERQHPLPGRIVELRYFGGLSQREIAEVCDVSLATVGRHWRFARAWLHHALTR